MKESNTIITKQQILDVMLKYMTSSYDNGTINDGGIQGGEEAADAILNLLQPQVSGSNCCKQCKKELDPKFRFCSPECKQYYYR
jgi:hypothetical protein